jgi:hypothetical protein
MLWAMFVITFQERHISYGQLDIPEIECASCKAKQLRMEFYLLEFETVAHVHRPKHCGAQTICKNCKEERPYHKLSKPVKEFYKANHSRFNGEFVFKFKLWFKILLVCFVVAGIFGYFKSGSDKKNRVTFEQRLEKNQSSEAKQRTPGAVYTVGEPLDKNFDPNGLNHTWLKLLRVDGDKIIFAKHREKLSFITAANEHPAADPGGFSSEEIEFSLQKSGAEMLCPQGGDYQNSYKITDIRLPGE